MSYFKKLTVNKSITLEGSSISAVETSIYVPELGILLDAGRDPEICVDHVFITHSHIDHTGGLSKMLIIKPENDKIVQIYTPKEISDNCTQYITNTLNFSKSNHRDSYDYFKVYGKLPEETFEIITTTKKQLQVSVIKCFHSVPCVGYGFSEKRKKLKEQYKGLGNSEIGKLKRGGEEITEDVYQPLMVFLGDTNETIFTNAEIFKYPVIIIECTYYHDVDISNAKKNYHMHWKYLEQIIKLNTNIMFIVIHPSKKIDIKQIRKKYLYDNVKFF